MVFHPIGILGLSDGGGDIAMASSKRPHTTRLFRTRVLTRHVLRFSLVRKVLKRRAITGTCGSKTYGERDHMVFAVSVLVLC
jgi:hypothetical protein